MKKTQAKPTSKESGDDMLPEYKFDYGKARPNRFGARIQEGAVKVVLDNDVSEVFTTSESVNTVLRAIISTMPETGGRKRARKESEQRKSG
jgi:hypothetical protein